MTTAAATLAPSSAALSPEQLWRLFALAIAGRAQIRVLEGGRYRAAGRLDPERRPSAPAAVPIYDRRRRTARCLVLDLDAKVHSRDQVVLDSERVLEILGRANLPAFIDESPSGGRHVYVPLARPIGRDELVDVAERLSRLLLSLDVAPLRNASTGAIRPPGSAHPLGGHQTLVTGLADATWAITAPGSPQAWQRFVDALPSAAALTALKATGGSVSAVSELVAGQEPRGAYANVLRTGAFNREVYATPSEARFAAVCHLLRLGWSRQSVVTAAASGRFPGLLALSRPRSNPIAFLHEETGRAAEKLALRWDRERDRTIHTRVQPTPPGLPTSMPEHNPAAEYAFLRSWWTAVRHDSRLWKGTTSLVDRSVLQALGALAQMRGSRYVSCGTRSIGQAACLDHSTVAKALKRLRGQTDPFIELLQASADTDGAQGDLYELKIPVRHVTRAITDPWSPGLIERIHPAFWVLSRGSRYAYAALTDQPQSPRDLERSARPGSPLPCRLGPWLSDA